MKLERDSIPLDKEFPFQISEVELNQANSRPGTWHWHSYFEITWVLEGKGNYFVNGQEYTMEKDDIIIFNNVEPHGWKLLGGNMKLLVMIFSPEFVAEKISLFDAEYLKPFVERGSNFKNRVGHEETVNTEILKEKKNAMKRLEQAFTYINDHYCEKITLEEVAASVYMSSNYFSSYFRRVANISFSDYVTRLRVNRAREMLRENGANVTEIAMECGFNNISNFYRLYKKHMGKTPGDEKSKNN